MPLGTCHLPLATCYLLLATYYLLSDETTIAQQRTSMPTSRTRCTPTTSRSPPSASLHERRASASLLNLPLLRFACIPFPLSVFSVFGVHAYTFHGQVLARLRRARRGSGDARSRRAHPARLQVPPGLARFRLQVHQRDGMTRDQDGNNLWIVEQGFLGRSRCSRGRQYCADSGGVQVMCKSSCCCFFIVVGSYCQFAHAITKGP